VARRDIEHLVAASGLDLEFVAERLLRNPARHDRAVVARPLERGLGKRGTAYVNLDAVELIFETAVAGAGINNAWTRLAHGRGNRCGEGSQLRLEERIPGGIGTRAVVTGGGRKKFHLPRVLDSGGGVGPTECHFADLWIVDRCAQARPDIEIGEIGTGGLGRESRCDAELNELRGGRQLGLR
jgi:hypothetical protein